jgi:hypothetical protein
LRVVRRVIRAFRGSKACRALTLLSPGRLARPGRRGRKVFRELTLLFPARKGNAAYKVFKVSPVKLALRGQRELTLLFPARKVSKVFKGSKGFPGK